MSMTESDVLLAIRRLIPLKPVYRSYMFHCPTCDKIVRIGFEERKINICKCGQKLDWSEGKE